jgi:hypothetical protein
MAPAKNTKKSEEQKKQPDEATTALAKTRRTDKQGIQKKKPHAKEHAEPSVCTALVATGGAGYVSFIPKSTARNAVVAMAMTGKGTTDVRVTMPAQMMFNRAIEAFVVDVVKGAHAAAAASGAKIIKLRHVEECK